MARDNPPIRLAADPNAPEALRNLVVHARKDIPDAATLSQLGTRLEAAIAANVAAPTVALPQSTFASGMAGITPLGVALGVLAGGVLAGSIWFGSRGNESSTLPASTSTPSVAMSAAPDGAMFATARRDSAPLAPTVAAASAASVESKAAATGNSTADGAATTPNGSSAAGTTRQQATGRNPNEEAALLLSARSALANNPAMALRLTREHARRFPSGNLVQEREVIAIEALRRLGQTDAAQKRGSAFEQRYPGSVHRSKIEQTLQGK